MIVESPSDTPMATRMDAENDAPPPMAPEPKRRRVRRKVTVEALDTVEDTYAVADAIEPGVVEAFNDDQPLVEAEEAPVQPEAEPVAAKIEPEPEVVRPAEVTPTPLVLAEAKPAPWPEADLATIIANDPAQISVPPVKPKRGWWRR